jgi:hypothetical protein
LSEIPDVPLACIFLIKNTTREVKKITTRKLDNVPIQSIFCRNDLGGTFGMGLAEKMDKDIFS